MGDFAVKKTPQRKAEGKESRKIKFKIQIPQTLEGTRTNEWLKLIQKKKWGNTNKYERGNKTFLLWMEVSNKKLNAIQWNLYKFRRFKELLLEKDEITIFIKNLLTARTVKIVDNELNTYIKPEQHE